MAVTRTSEQEIEIGYAETLTHDAQAQTATITMNLNGGNKVTYSTVQKPVTFSISDEDLNKLKGVSKDATDVDIVVNTKAGETDVPWHVASASDTWLTTDPAIDGTETNASGSTLTVKFAANDTGDRTGSFVLESRNTSSPAYGVSQNGTFGVTINDVKYNDKTALFANDTLKAFSAAYDYTFNITTKNAVAGNKLSVASKTSGSKVTVKTQPSGTALTTSHTFVISVPASTLTDEPESAFDIMADGNKVGGFAVKQAKKPSISVNTSTTVGGTSTPVSGSFVASTWDIKSTDYVTSSDATLSIANPSTAGTFSVNMKPSFLQTDDNLTATITLVGVNGNLGTCSIAQNKVVYAFSPTAGVAFKYNETTTGKTVTVTSSNAGTISSGMTAESSQTWCTVSVSGNKVTAKVTQNTGNTSRTATVYVTYKDSRSQTFEVVQGYNVPATVTIGGVVWSSFNVNTPGTLATNVPSALLGTRAESHGKYYQWNRKVAWFTTGGVSGWDTSNPSGTSWGSSTNPCPSGFVVPTKAQWDALISACTKSYKGGWSSSDYGYLELKNGSNTLEFPAVGGRYDSDGALSSTGTWGYYWSSTQDGSDRAYNMKFSSGSVGTYWYRRRYGFSVRCVRDIPHETVKIGDTEWMKYNVDNPGTVVASLPSALTGTRAASHGKFYQWNRNKAWATTDGISGWDTTTPGGSDWETANNPCPSGFEVPNKAQWEALIAACNATYMSGSWSSSNYGYLTLTYKTNSANKLEFPAVGYRNDTDGSLYGAGTYGFYWSSTQNGSDYAYRLDFGSSSVSTSNGNKTNGRSVRCVRQ